MFNVKLAKAMLNQRPTHRPRLDAFDLEAERQAGAIFRAARPLFKGSRLMNRAPSRVALRG